MDVFDVDLRRFCYGDSPEEFHHPDYLVLSLEGVGVDRRCKGILLALEVAVLPESGREFLHHLRGGHQGIRLVHRWSQNSVNAAYDAA